MIILFPEVKLKSKKREKLLACIAHHYNDKFNNLQKMQRELKAKEAEKKESVFMNEATTKKISELESKLQESERERLKQRHERDELMR